MRTIYIPLFIAMLALTGCDKSAQLTDEQEEREPFVKTGQAFMDQQQWEDAETAFKQAIDNKPLIARPHLDLAIIYQQYKINYIHAIYHYDRYLELRPDSEKTEFINEQKLKVAQALANTLINTSPEVKQVVAQRNQLVQENAALKQQLATETTSKNVEPAKQTVTKTIPKTASKPVATSKPASVSTTHQIYQVASGDTLTKIATKFYGDSGKWDIIFEANKDTMSSPSNLRVGQSLVIPKQ